MIKKQKNSRVFIKLQVATKLLTYHLWTSYFNNFLTNSLELAYATLTQGWESHHGTLNNFN